MKKSTYGLGRMAVLFLLSFSLVVIKMPAFADPQSCKIPEHVKKRLEMACSEAVAKGRIAPVEKLDFNTVMKLAKQQKCMNVKVCALYSIGEIKDARATETLLPMLNHENLHVRRIAAHSLGKIGDKRAVMPLIEVICREDEPAPVQSAAILALGRLGDPRATRILTYLTLQETGWVQREASKAVVRIRSTDET